MVYTPELVKAALPHGDSGSIVPLAATLANLLGACLAVQAMTSCRRRALYLGGLAALSLCLVAVAYLISGAAASSSHSSQLPLAAALALWCLAYELGPGAGYFVLVGDLAKPPMATAVYAIGESL